MIKWITDRRPTADSEGEGMKFCKDCKHHIKSKIDWCNAKNYINPDAVNDLSRICEYQRNSGWLVSRVERKCGREGRFFEQKEVKT